MIAPWTCATIVALATIASMWRSARRFGASSRPEAAPASRGWRHAIVWAQPVLAALFYLFLFPPHTSQRGDALTVITPGATKAQLRDLPRAQRVAVLPDAPATAGAGRVPDLASALRESPEVSKLSIVGGALPLRDQESASSLGSTFDAAPLHGIVELLAPTRALTGALWTASGRVTTPRRRSSCAIPRAPSSTPFPSTATAASDCPRRHARRVRRASSCERSTRSALSSTARRCPSTRRRAMPSRSSCGRERRIRSSSTSAAGRRRPGSTCGSRRG
jgi:hypothetical protein